jgi:hypothetical protein
MATKQQVIKKCLELGCMLLDCGDCLRVDPPVGKVVSATGSHTLDLYLGTRGYKRSEAYAEIMADLRMGIDECTDPECDSCVLDPSGSDFKALQSLYRGERLA